MPQKVKNKYGIEIRVGDRLKIMQDRIAGKLLANVEKGEIIVVTSFSEDGKIMYHHNSLALAVDSDFFVNLDGQT